MSIYVVVWDNGGEVGTQRERRVDAIYDTAEQAQAHLAEADALGIGSYLHISIVPDEAAAKALEIYPSKPGDDLWRFMEDAMDRADFEAIQ